MKKQTTESKKPSLAAGQWWQMKDCYIRIASVGKTLVDYKMLKKPGQRGVQTQMGNIASVLAFLRANRAKLIETPQP